MVHLPLDFHLKFQICLKKSDKEMFTLYLVFVLIFALIEL